MWRRKRKEEEKQQPEDRTFERKFIHMNGPCNNRGSELREKALGSEVCLMYMVRSDRHLQMILGRLYERKIVKQYKEKQYKFKVMLITKLQIPSA
jgi:hypothetical protein